jgi:hypothetical protein
MDEGPEKESPLSLEPKKENERNWLPMGLGAVVVAIIVIVVIVFGRMGSGGPSVGDPYIAKLQLSNLHMATAENFAGGTVTYIQGTITNSGDKKLTSARVELIFKNSLSEVSQKEVLPLSVRIPTSPYEDYGSLDRAPLAPGEKRDFRVTVEHVTADWDGQIPQMTVVAVSTS